MSFGDNLKRLRTAAKLSQGKLERQCGLSAGVIYRYEIGERHPNYSTIKNLCNVLNCTATELLGF